MPLPIAEAYTQVTGLKANNKLKQMWQKGIMESFDEHIVMEFWQIFSQNCLCEGLGLKKVPSQH